MTDPDREHEFENFRVINCNCFEDHIEAANFLRINSKKNLTIIHLNIRSYFKNFDAALIMLQGLDIKFDVIAFTEAWVDDDKPVLELDGYDVFTTTGTNNWNRNDGTIVYLNTDLCGVMQLITLGEATGLQLEFTVNKRHFKILTTYRSPSMDCNLFLNDLEIYCSGVNSNVTNILMGDINIDILPENCVCRFKDDYLNILYSAGFIEAITVPTRVAGNTKSCLDHIFTNHPNYSNITSCVLKTNITDHFPVIAKIELDTRPPDCDTSDTYLDSDVLSDLMATQTWDHVLALNDVNDCCDAFLGTFDDLKARSLRPKKLSTRFKKLKPWISTELIFAIRKRDKLSKLVNKRPNDEQLKLQFNALRNNLSRKIKITKQNFYRNKINLFTNNPRMFWRTINEYNGSKTVKNKFPISHFVRESEAGVGLIREVANSFNDFFSNVGSRLASELPAPVGPPLVDDATYRAGHEFRLRPVTDSQVVECVKQMRGGSAPGCDEFSPKILKDHLQILKQPLTHLVNLSISTGIFPNKFKVAKVIPLHKSKSKSDTNNYRPISLLSVLAKVLEKCVKLQLQSYLECNHILSDRQFGFRKGTGTADALFFINKFIINSVNTSEKILITFIDLAKAFDSIDRNSLFYKLECIGVNGIELKWFKSYLSSRSQVVSLNGVVSDERCVDYGIIQGSTLGPLLFLIYINNIDKLPLSGEVFLFADDTAVIFKGSSWEEVFHKASSELKILRNWFIQNVLTMNVSKTKCMPIALRPASEPPPELRLVLHTCDTDAATPGNCDCQVVEKVWHYKYLGTVMDSKLKWENHVNLIKLKLRKMIFVFYQLSKILNERDLKTIYYAYVQSYLQYGLVAWGGCFHSIIEPLNVIQRSIIKAIFQKPKRYASALLHQESGLLSIRQLYVRNLLVFLYNNENLVAAPVTHNYRTRNAVNVGLQVPRVVKSINLTNAFYIGNFLLRKIPVEIRNLQVPLPAYKRIVTAWLAQIGPVIAESLITPEYSL